MTTAEITKRARFWVHKAYRAKVLQEFAPIRWKSGKNVLLRPSAFTDPECKTAYWKPYLDGRRFMHEIRISSQCLDSVAVGVSGSPAKITKYIRSLMRHEMAHAAFSTLDLKSIGDFCRKHKVNYSLFNLFEDIRIEAKWVTAGGADDKKLAEPFDWTTFLPAPNVEKGASEPFRNAAVLLWILARGFVSSSELTKAVRKGIPLASAKAFVATLCDFWKRAEKCADSWTAAALAVEFQNQFPMSHAIPPNLGADGYYSQAGPDGEIGRPIEGSFDAARDAGQAARDAGDTMAGADAADKTGADAADKTGADAADKTGADAADKTGADSADKTAPPTDAQPDVKNSTATGETLPTLTKEESKLFNQLGAARGPWSIRTDELQQIKNRMRSTFEKSGFATARLATSGRRLNVAGVAVGSQFAFRGISPAVGVPSVCLILDLSASMAQAYAAHAAQFAIALLQLQKENRVRVKIWASGAAKESNGGGAFSMEISRFGVAGIHALSACGRSENIAATLMAARADIKAADVSVCYTDGNITDAAPRATAAGVVGVVVSPADMNSWHAANILKHFSRARVCVTPTELAREVAVLAVK